MANTYNLDDIRAEMEARYGSMPVVVGDRTVHLTSILKLDKASRQTVNDQLSLMDDMDDDGLTRIDEAVSAMQNVLRTAAGGDGDYLVEQIGDDILTLQYLVREWGRSTQLGEASDSPS